MSRGAAARALLLLLALPLLWGCGAWRALRGPLPCRGALVASTALGPEFHERALLRYQLEDADAPVRIELALEHRAGELVLVGFDPVGAELFALIQRGREVERRGRPLAAQQVHPLTVLRDVHRARFLPREHGLEETPAVAVSFSQGPGAPVRIDNPACGYRAELVPLGAAR